MCYSESMKLKADNPALLTMRTIHPKSLQEVKPTSNLLKSAAHNGKVGKGAGIITRGRLAGQPLFSLTLEERATCPLTCERLAECYGNATPFAHRFSHGIELESKLREEVAELAKLYRNGFLVRLHILGDFYSVEYVKLWAELLTMYPMMTIYGYTARLVGTPIGNAIAALRIQSPNRFWVRFSQSEKYNGGANIFAAQEGTVGITCPEQTEKTKSCLTCGLCWAISSTIIFLDHDKKNKAKREKSTERPAAAFA